MSKNGRTLTLNRPIQHLYPLEVVSHNSSVAEPEDNPVDEPRSEDPRPEPEQSSISSTRPKRSAAKRAHDRILAQAVSEWEGES